ncbi:MAG: hypothetical protein WC152_00880 [Candidatus Izemoplasmatales bacterium]
MNLLYALASALVGFGIFLIAADLARIPLFKTSKAVTHLSKRQKKKTPSLELWLKDLALWLSKRLRLNEYKRMQLLSDLQTANMNITPELHIANAIVKAALCLLLIPFALLVFPIITPLVVILAITMYMKEARGIQERIKARRDAIEYELPRLVFTIENTLTHSRDVLAILNDYRENAGAELRYELDITVADMRSGNYESALTRLEARVGSSMLSDVTRGLISLLRGDETAMYWSALSIKFADYQRQMLKARAQKVPGKIKRLSMILLFCFMSFYLVVIIVEVINSLGVMFG